jgi:hypothetical protein
VNGVAEHRDRHAPRTSFVNGGPAGHQVGSPAAAPRTPAPVTGLWRALGLTVASALVWGVAHVRAGRRAAGFLSHHLAKLKLAGLVRSRREGRRQIYLVDDPHIVTIVRQMVDRMREQPAGSRRGRGVGA